MIKTVLTFRYYCGNAFLNQIDTNIQHENIALSNNFKGVAPGSTANIVAEH